MVGSGKLGAPEDSAALDMSPSTAYKYMVDLSSNNRYWNTKSSGASPASGTKITRFDPNFPFQWITNNILLTECYSTSHLSFQMAFSLLIPEKCCELSFVEF